MFKFLKDKLKGAISKFSQRAEDEGEIEKKVVEKQALEIPEEGPPIVEKVVEEPALKQEIESLLEQETEDTLREKHPQNTESELKEPKSVSSQNEEMPIPKDPKIEPQQQAQKKPSLLKSLFSRKEPIKIVPPEKKQEFVELPKQAPKERSYAPLGEKPHVEKEPLHKGAAKSSDTGQIQTEEKKGFFSKITEVITTTRIGQEKFEDLFSDLELILLENNVAVEVIDKIKNDLSKDIVDKPIKRTRVEEEIAHSLKVSIEDLFNIERISLEDSIKNKAKKPYVIAFFGINGSGKTTSIAKLGHLLKKKGFSAIMAAGDTFRAASIEQLEHHGSKLDIKVIKQGYGSDPAAVAFDAIKHAESKNIDVVLIDTAGRLHSNVNLLKEMEKIIRVANPDLKLFVGESITGNDCVEQAKTFNAAVGIDGLILTKADVDEKGGAAISIGYVTQKPILYLGMGQDYDDLKEFDSKLVVEGLGL